MSLTVILDIPKGMKQILLVFVKRTARSHTKRKKSNLLISSGESGVNPVADLLNQNYHPLDDVPSVNTDVFPVSNVLKEDPCAVLVPQLVLKLMQQSLQLNSSSE